MAQCWILDIHACNVFIVLTFCKMKEKISTIVGWVDDMVGIANTKETNNKVVDKLAAKYKIKVIGKLNILLRVHIMTMKIAQSDSQNPLYLPDIEGVQHGEGEYCIDAYGSK